MEEITLKGLRFHALVGILPHEREHPQPLVVDITVWRAPERPGEDVLDYRRLYDLVADEVQGSVHYLERTAHAIANRASRAAGVRRVRVTLRKPAVALPGPLEFAEVSVELGGER